MDVGSARISLHDPTHTLTILLEGRVIYEHDPLLYNYNKLHDLAVAVNLGCTENRQIGRLPASQLSSASPVLYTS